MERYQEVNAKAISRWCEEGWEWGKPISHEVFRDAQQGKWGVYLTPTKIVPHEWFGKMKGKKILGLASGGGQQILQRRVLDLGAAGGHALVLCPAADLLQLVGRHLLDHGPCLLGQRRVVPGRRARQAVRQIDGVHRPAGLEQFGHRVLAPDQGVGCLFGVGVLRAGLPLRFAVIFHAVPPSAPVL